MPGIPPGVPSREALTTGPLTDRVARAFDEFGPLATAFPGFEVRPGQLRLAVEVARAFEHGGTLIAEAGTGFKVKLKLLLAVQPLPSVTITVYVPDDAGEIHSAVPPFDQLYDVNVAGVHN